MDYLLNIFFKLVDLKIHNFAFYHFRKGKLLFKQSSQIQGIFLPFFLNILTLLGYHLTSVT